MDTVNNCAVIDGRISVYVEGTATDDTKEETLDTIKNGMENGIAINGLRFEWYTKSNLYLYVII